MKSRSKESMKKVEFHHQMLAKSKF